MNNNTKPKASIFDEIKTMICESYKQAAIENLEETIDKTISDIKKCNKELLLYDTLQHFYKCYKHKHGKTIDKLIKKDNVSWMPVGKPHNNKK